MGVHEHRAHTKVDRLIKAIEDLTHELRIAQRNESLRKQIPPVVIESWADLSAERAIHQSPE